MYFLKLALFALFVNPFHCLFRVLHLHWKACTLLFVTMTKKIWTWIWIYIPLKSNLQLKDIQTHRTITYFLCILHKNAIHSYVPTVKAGCNSISNMGLLLQSLHAHVAVICWRLPVPLYVMFDYHQSIVFRHSSVSWVFLNVFVIYSHKLVAIDARDVLRDTKYACMTSEVNKVHSYT